MNISDDLYKEILGLLFGFVILIIGLVSNNKRKKLNKIGITVQGIVFEIIQSTTGADRSMYHPVIRFLTTEKEWITEKYDIAGQYGAYTEGADVTVIYDPQNPKDFILNDTRTQVVGLLLSLIGIIAIVISAFLMVYNG